MYEVTLIQNTLIKMDRTKGKIVKSTIKVNDFNTSLLITDRTNSQKISKDIDLTLKNSASILFRRTRGIHQIVHYPRPEANFNKF